MGSTSTYKLKQRLTEHVEPTLFLRLTMQGTLTNNLIFSKVQDEDPELESIGLDIDQCASRVKDKRIRTFVKHLRSICHKTYSAWIYVRLLRQTFDTLPAAADVAFRRERKMLDELQKYQNNLSIRIDELLEGAEDE
jgi:hypothetical protein